MSTVWGIDGDMVVLGLPSVDNTPSVALSTLVFSARRRMYGSQVDGMRETQEMLEYSVANSLYPRVAIIPIQRLDAAYQYGLAGTVKCRDVIDMITLT